jgi:hypothetical protein
MFVLAKRPRCSTSSSNESWPVTAATWTCRGAMTALRAGTATLKSSPFTCRKAGNSPVLRELVIPFGRSGHVALFEIEDESTVAVAAVRHLLEDDYH